MKFILLTVLLIFALVGMSGNAISDEGARPYSLNRSLLLTDNQLKEDKDRANNGDVHAAVRLYKHYHYGMGNDVEALRWGRLAADLGRADIRTDIALIILAKAKSLQERQEGLRYLVAAVEAGDSSAAGEISSAFRFGYYGIRRDTGKADCWEAVERELKHARKSKAVVDWSRCSLEP